MFKKIRGFMALSLALICFMPAISVHAEEAYVAPEQAVVTDPAATVPATAEYVSPEQVLYNQAAADVVAKQTTRQIVFIGDSRTVGMKSAIGNDGNVWSAKVGMGYSWMKSTGVPQVEANINANTDVVILMGVNDVRSLSYTKKYVSYLNDKAAAWTALGANVYYVSVNPMAFETSSYPGITNSLIESWNSRMKQGLSANIAYIDTYSKVVGQVSSSDGIHYSKSSYKTIYSLINQGIIEDKTTKEYAALLSAATVQAVPATPEVPATVDAPVAY